MCIPVPLDALRELDILFVATCINFLFDAPLLLDHMNTSDNTWDHVSIIRLSVGFGGGGQGDVPRNTFELIISFCIWEHHHCISTIFYKTSAPAIKTKFEHDSKVFLTNL